MTPDPVRVALYTCLAGDDDLQGLLSGPTAIFHAKAPQGTEPPYVIFNLMSGTEVWTFGDSHERAIWLVKGVCRDGSATAAEEIDARCRELLNRTRLAVAGGTLTILRESVVSYGEDRDGETWPHRGSLYRVFHT